VTRFDVEQETTHDSTGLVTSLPVSQDSSSQTGSSVPVSSNGVVLRGTRSDVSVVSGVVGQGVVSLSTSQTGTGRTVSSLSVLVTSGQTRVLVVVVTSQARADTGSVLVVVVASQARANASSGETRADTGSVLLVLVVAGQTRGETRAGVGRTGKTGAVLVVVSVVEVTSNGVGGSTGGGEVGSRVLEGLSASGADSRDARQ